MRLLGIFQHSCIRLSYNSCMDHFWINCLNHWVFNPSDLNIAGECGYSTCQLQSQCDPHPWCLLPEWLREGIVPIHPGVLVVPRLLWARPTTCRQQRKDRRYIYTLQFDSSQCPIRFPYVSPYVSPCHVSPYVSPMFPNTFPLCFPIHFLNVNPYVSPRIPIRFPHFSTYVSPCLLMRFPMSLSNDFWVYCCWCILLVMF